jgi:hypothetical protein
LHKLGCDQYQGFYFSRPVDATRFEEMLRGGNAPDGECSAHKADRTHSRLAILPTIANVK